jgi:hypothetical protein
MKITAVSIVIAGSLLCGATAALAQATTGASGGTAATNPGAIGNGTAPTQSLQPPSGGQGMGYSPSAPSLGVSPDATGSTTYSRNGAISPMPGTSTTGSGSSASDVSGSSNPSNGG